MCRVCCRNSSSYAGQSGREMKNHMAKNKETSHRGAGKGQKLLSGTRDQLIKDLQRVHKFSRRRSQTETFTVVHGKYADAAWQETFFTLQGLRGSRRAGVDAG